MIIQKKNQENNTFSHMLDEQLKEKNIIPGSLVKAKIVFIDKNFVLVDSNLKSIVKIPIKEFYNSDNSIVDINIGNEIDVIVEYIDNGFGETKLSREKARKIESWKNLENAYENNKLIVGTIIDRVKGGFTINIDKISAFLPGSLIDTTNNKNLIGKTLEFKLIKIDKKLNNIVVSRKAAIEKDINIEKDRILNTLKENDIVKGIVKNITDYGAFIDLGGIDGLLHITDISWKRIKHPSDHLSIGQNINIKILKFDKEKRRVSLGVKQLIEDPWKNMSLKFPVGKIVSGKVTNITDYGCFVEIESGIEGLVHMSEMDWTNKNIHPEKVVSIADTINVKILDINIERKRISLGMKQCKENPWYTYSLKYKSGDITEGIIKSITDFGIFVELEGYIDGLIHISDISWEKNSQEKIKSYKKGEKVSVMILLVDYKKERISLGIKQLLKNPFTDFMNNKSIGNIVSGTVDSIKDDIIKIKINNGIFGILKNRDKKDKIYIGKTIRAEIIKFNEEAKLVILSEKNEIKKSNFKNKVLNDESLGTLLKNKIRENQDQ